MRQLIIDWLPWPISAITICQLWMTGNKHRHAWLVSIGNQALWSVWIWASWSIGLLPMNIAFWILAVRNHIKWNRKEAPLPDEIEKTAQSTLRNHSEELATFAMKANELLDRLRRKKQ